MKTNYKNYFLFHKFIETFSAVGLQGISPDNSLLLELEEMMEHNNQFFFFGDLFQMKIFYTSKRSTLMFGIDPAEVNPYHYFEATHPDDLERYTLGRAKIFKLAQDLFTAERGYAIISTNVRIRNPKGQYINTLFQCYLLYSSIPHKTVYLFQVHTDISWYKKIKYGFHYYAGNDMAYFKYPDEKMLREGNIFTDREFEIIRLIALGNSSEQIAAILFLSRYTVNTHRRNILKKSGKTHLSELIFDLKEMGLL
jgi:DNA-binding CsgD family transcriptional regulator